MGLRHASGSQLELQNLPSLLRIRSLMPQVDHSAKCCSRSGIRNFCPKNGNTIDKPAVRLTPSYSGARHQAQLFDFRFSTLRLSRANRAALRPSYKKLLLMFSKTVTHRYVFLIASGRILGSPMMSRKATEDRTPQTARSLAREASSEFQSGNFLKSPHLGEWVFEVYHDPMISFSTGCLYAEAKEPNVPLMGECRKHEYYY